LLRQTPLNNQKEPQTGLMDLGEAESKGLPKKHAAFSLNGSTPWLVDA